MKLSKCGHKLEYEKRDNYFIMERCNLCGLFRLAKRSLLSRQTDEIVEIYQRRGYHFLDEIKDRNKPNWVELTLDELGEIIHDKKPFPV